MARATATQARASIGALALLVATLAALALPAGSSAATASCPPAPALSATTYDAAVAELRTKRSALVARQVMVRSARARGTIVEPPKTSLEGRVCYLNFKVSDGSMARMAVKPGIAVVKPGTADGATTPSKPPASTSTTVPATQTPAPTAPAGSASGSSDAARRDFGKVIGDIIAQGARRQPERPPTVDDVRPSPQPPAHACPPLPQFSPQTVDAAIAALRRLPRVKPEPRSAPSALPRGTLLAAPTQQLAADGMCHVTLVVSDGSLVRVPAIVGLAREQAQSTVLQAGLQFDAAQAASSAAAAGSILRQDPPAGTEVRRGTLVRTTVARAADLVVPNVIGAHGDSARARLTSFRVEQASVESLRPAGEVVQQDPRGGERRPPGTLVRISTSDGSLVRVPAITGLDADAARSRLAGLELGLASTTREDAAAPNAVVAQDPAAGTAVKRGTRITAAVSAGLAVPRVIDLQVDAARAALAPFMVDSVLTESQATRDRVLTQSPEPGTRVAAGTRITLGVSDASLVPVPDVVNRTLGEARAALASAELVLRVADGTADADAAVTAQAPPPAAVVRRGSEVSLSVRGSVPSWLIGAAALLLCAAVAYRWRAAVYRWLKARLTNHGNDKPVPPPAISVVATVQFQPAPPQPEDEVERRGADLTVDARLDAGDTEVEMEEKVHA